MIFEGAEFREVSGFPGYFCSADGRVVSIKSGNPKLKRPTLMTIGYFSVVLYGGEKKYGDKEMKKEVGHARYVHRLVAELWIPRIDGKNEVNHRNAVKTDNRVENLEWCTHAENVAHAKKTLHFNRGEKHGMAKLTEAGAIKIKSRILAGHRLIDIARDFGLKPSTVSYIKTGRLWSHVSGIRL